jgi:hypothetical protein
MDYLDIRENVKLNTNELSPAPVPSNRDRAGDYRNIVMLTETIQNKMGWQKHNNLV